MLLVPLILLISIALTLVGVAAVTSMRRKSQLPPCNSVTAARAPGSLSEWALVVVGILSIAIAAYIAIRQTSILEHQADIAEQQRRLMSLEYTPYLSFDVYFPLTATGEAFADQLVITNSGAPIRSFTYDVYVFFQIDKVHPDGTRDPVFIPIINYYSDPSFERKESGELARLSKHGVTKGNNAMAGELSIDFAFLARNRGESFGGPALVRIVHAQYVDRLNENHTEAYRIDSKGVRPLSSSEMDEAKAAFASGVQEGFAISFDDDLSAEDLWNAWQIAHEHPPTR